MLQKKTIFAAIFAILAQNAFCENLDNDSSIECDDEGVITYDTSSDETVKIYLLTPLNETLELNSTNLDLVNTSLPTKIIIHGLSSHDNRMWVDEMATNYHTKGNYNVIEVDWAKISTDDSYYVASAVDSVGNILGDFILEITKTNVEHMNDIHLIGAYEGAQIGAVAGEKVAGKGNAKIGRITGLDPTEPEDLGLLDENDAEFVDVIHTTKFVGEKSVGTVNFYISDDDPSRPVCYNDTCEELVGSSYFTKTIVDEERFIGIPCQNSSCNGSDGVPMGEYVSRNATGNYLVAKDDAFGIHFQGNIVLSLTAALVLKYLL